MSELWPDGPIITARLTLRRPEPADAPRIAAYVGDPVVSRMLTSVPHPYGLEEAQAFVAQWDDPPPGQRAFAVADADGLAGVLGFTLREGAMLTEVGYWYGPRCWGAGYATEALAAALERARAWGLRALCSSHFVDNPASGRVLEKAGFLYTGARRTQMSLARGEEVEARAMVWLA